MGFWSSLLKNGGKAIGATSRSVGVLYCTLLKH